MPGARWAERTAATAQYLLIGSPWIPRLVSPVSIPWNAALAGRTRLRRRTPAVPIPGFDGICGDGAEHVDTRVLQRALLHGLIRVGDRGEKTLVTLTESGEAKILAHRDG
jgi:hypothetical protein